MTLKTDLCAVRDLISNSNNWTQLVNAEDIHGQTVNPLSPKACKWCLMGAIIKATSKPENIVNLFDETLRGFANAQVKITSFNDNSQHKEVINLLDKLIADQNIETQN